MPKEKTLAQLERELAGYMTQMKKYRIISMNGYSHTYIGKDIKCLLH